MAVSEKCLITAQCKIQIHIVFSVHLTLNETQRLKFGCSGWIKETPLFLGGSVTRNLE